MKKLTIISVVVIVAIFSYCAGKDYAVRELHKYQNYYDATEALLDTLENEYGWVDAIDNYPYYEALDKLHN